MHTEVAQGGQWASQGQMWATVDRLREEPGPQEGCEVT